MLKGEALAVVMKFSTRAWPANDFIEVSFQSVSGRHSVQFTSMCLVFAVLERCSVMFLLNLRIGAVGTRTFISLDLVATDLIQAGWGRIM